MMSVKDIIAIIERKKIKTECVALFCFGYPGIQKQKFFDISIFGEGKMH